MNITTRVIAGLGSLALTLNIATVAHAEDPAKTIATIALGQTSLSGNSDETPLSSLANLAESKTTNSYIAKFVDKASIEIPSKPTDQIRFSSRLGSTISVALPYASKAKQALSISIGALVFDNQNESISAVMAKSDGSLQMATVLISSKAPSQYAYTFKLPVGIQAKLASDGGLMFLDSDARYLGGVARPWAKDSHGQSVPTHYELSGATLTQVVDHKGVPYNYPNCC